MFYLCIEYLDKTGETQYMYTNEYFADADVADYVVDAHNEKAPDGMTFFVTDEEDYNIDLEQGIGSAYITTEALKTRV